MNKTIDELLKTHHLVRKVLEGFDINNTRFAEITKTLHRTLLAHAWFHDEILLPVLREKSAPEETPLINEIMQEHKDLDRLLKESVAPAQVLEIQNLIETHFKKESETLYPLAEKNIEPEALNELGEKMKTHQSDIRDVLEKQNFIESKN
jgi:iron-sulfur cluster repair protein YtfE (RIC family)